MNSRSALLTLAIFLTSSCTTTPMGALWSTWTWRDAATLKEWEEFYPLARKEWTRCSNCAGQLDIPYDTRCVDPRLLGNPKARPATTCEEAARLWEQRIAASFVGTHPDIDSVTRRYVETGRIEPALNASTVVEQAGLMQEEDTAREAAEREAEHQRREREERAEAERAERNPYCSALARGVGQLKPCISTESVASHYLRGWHGQALNSPVDMQACLVGQYEPFDFRLVDPKTGATRLLSLQAVNGFAIALTPSGQCLGAVKVLLTPNEADFVDGIRREDSNFYSGVSVHVSGTYQGLYPQQVIATEPSVLLIRAMNVQRPKEIRKARQ